jgi:hypothetical protein
MGPPQGWCLLHALGSALLVVLAGWGRLLSFVLGFAWRAGTEVVGNRQRCARVRAALVTPAQPAPPTQLPASAPQALTPRLGRGRAPRVRRACLALQQACPPRLAPGAVPRAMLAPRAPPPTWRPSVPSGATVWLGLLPAPRALRGSMEMFKACSPPLARLPAPGVPTAARQA